MNARLRTALVCAAVAAVGAGILGGPHDKRAGAPFAYSPPDGFAKDAPEPGALAAWRLAEGAGSHAFVPRVQVSRSASRSTVEEPDLARIASQLHDSWVSSGIEWTERRHETRVRPDGAHVGIIEGDCTRRVEGSIVKGIHLDVHFRKLQMVFPDDDGTSIVTADFGVDDAPQWEAAFEDSITKTTGVATRVPSAPWWVFAGGGAGGFVIGWLIGALYASRANANANANANADAKADA